MFDDFNGVDVDDTADSAAEFLELLGLQTKPSKAQPPALKTGSQLLVQVDGTGVVLQPTPKQIRKILAAINSALDEDDLAPDVANKLAGRLNFHHISSHSRRSAHWGTQPIYEGARRGGHVGHLVVDGPALRHSGRCAGAPGGHPEGEGATHRRRGRPVGGDLRRCLLPQGGPLPDGGQHQAQHPRPEWFARKVPECAGCFTGHCRYRRSAGVAEDPRQHAGRLDHPRRLSDEVVEEVVHRHVMCPHHGVVARPPPLFGPPHLHLFVLVLLGRRPRECLAGRRCDEAPMGAGFERVLCEVRRASGSREVLGHAGDVNVPAGGLGYVLHQMPDPWLMSCRQKKQWRGDGTVPPPLHRVHLGSGVGEASADDAIDMTTQQYSASVCRWRSLFLTAAGVGLKGHWQARSAAPSVLGPAALRDFCETRRRSPTKPGTGGFWAAAGRLASSSAGVVEHGSFSRPTQPPPGRRASGEWHGCPPVR